MLHTHHGDVPFSPGRETNNYDGGRGGSTYHVHEMLNDLLRDVKLDDDVLVRLLWMMKHINFIVISMGCETKNVS